MKKTYTFFYSILIPITLVGQDKLIELDWNNTDESKWSVNFTKKYCE